MSDRTRRQIPRALPSTPDVKRFEARLTPGPDACWNWIGAQAGSLRPYGHFTMAGRVGIYAHRWSYEYHVGPIPEGLEIDHLCANRLCVNPWHLEPVTGAVNRRRYAETFTHCPQGHEYTPENTSVGTGPKAGKQCRTCKREAERRSREAWRSENPLSPVTHCIHGHEFTPENTYIKPSGSRACKECTRRRARESARRRRARERAAK